MLAVGNISQVAETHNGQTGPMGESYFTSSRMLESAGLLLMGLWCLGQGRPCLGLSFGMELLFWCWHTPVASGM